jgi:hypothetical protein
MASGNVCQEETLYLIGLTCKLCKKWSVVNMHSLQESLENMHQFFFLIKSKRLAIKSGGSEFHLSEISPSFSEAQNLHLKSLHVNFQYIL